MLKIRLQRVGRKHEPGFRLVLTDSKNSTKSGRFAEVLGSYDPRKASEVLKMDRIKHWLSRGAGLTESVNNLLIRKGIIRGKKIHVSKSVVQPAAQAQGEAEPSAEPPAPVEVEAEAKPSPEPAVSDTISTDTEQSEQQNG